MSGSNAISGITIIGALTAQQATASTLAALAVVGAFACFTWAREHHSWLPYTLNITDGFAADGGLVYFEHRLEETDLHPTRYVTAVLTTSKPTPRPEI